MKINLDAVDTAFLEDRTLDIARSGEDHQLRYRPGGVALCSEEQNFWRNNFPDMNDYGVNRMVHSVSRVNHRGFVSAYASFHTTPYDETSLTFCGVLPHLREQGLAKEIIAAALTVVKRVRGDDLTEIGFTFLENLPDKVRQSVIRLVEEAGLEREL